MKKKISSLIALLLLVLVPGCKNNIAPTEPTNGAAADMAIRDEETEAKSIIHLQMREVDVLDPILTKHQSVRDGLMAVFEPLYNINASFGAEAVLAESFAFNRDATIMTLKVKSGVLWHNGHQFNADDVVYTVNKIKQNPSSSYYANLETVDRVEKQSEYEVVFYFKRPNAQFVYSLYFPIEFRNSDVTGGLIGTGAYMFQKTDGKSLTLTKNTSWHGGNAQAEGVEFIYMRTSAMAEEAFESGKIHAITKEMLDTENFAVKKTHKKYVYPDGIFEFVGFNANRGIFKSSLIRIAASNAIDRGEMEIVFDDAVQSGFPVMSRSEAFSPSFEVNSYNLDWAKEVIFSAGWTDSDGDGIYEKTVGEEVQKLSFSLLVADRDPLRALAAEKIKQQLEKAGFEVTVEICDIETYNARVAGGEYDAFLGAVYYDAPYDVSDLLASKGLVNYQGYKSTEMDNALKAFQSASDENDSTKAFNEIQALYMAHQPIAGLVFRTTYVVTTPSIGGEVNPYPYSPYANIANWTVE